MPTVTLDFKTDDKNLNLQGTVNFRRQIPVENLRVAGLAEWRHVPANIVHVSHDTIEELNLTNYSSNLAKVGVNWIGIRARTNILLSYAIRSSDRLGRMKVQEQLTKFFKAIGATSVKFTACASDIDDFNDEDLD